MTMTEDLARIATDDDWLDLREGDKALLCGTIDAMPGGSDILLVTGSSWSQIAVRIEGGDRDAGILRLGGLEPRTRIGLVMTRDEDGPCATWDDVRDLSVFA